MVSVGRYIARELTPVVVESVKYAADELRPTIRQYAKEIRSDSGGEKEDPVIRMKHLDELKRSGLLSPEEYQRKRAEILGDI